MHTLDQNNSWIYLPEYVEIFVSDDGKQFRSVGKGNDYTTDTLTLGYITVSVPKQSARYLKLVAKNYGVIPDGKPGGGNKAWLFADEIKIY
jgi:hexosaminidase